MSTLTPNYNLEKPDATERYDLFRQLFNDNMDIIDENLGGGGGGGNVDDVEVNGVSVLDPVTKIAEITSYEEVTQAEYNALPDDKLSNGVAYFIKDSVNGADGFPPLIYSLEERQVGVWQDGKPLYQKTIILGSLIMDTGFHSVAHGISDFELMVQAEGSFYDGSQWRNIETYRPTSTYGVNINVTPTNINYINNWVSSVQQAYLTIWYTKTTDVAGSGDWTPSGALAVHYSTNEQVIGTYLGKPLYQKTWSGLNVTPAYNSWTNVIANDRAIDILVDWEALSDGDHKNLNGCGIEFQVTSSYIRAEYNQNANVRTFEILTLRYTNTTDV
jgi:hypothetical protein